MDNKDKIIQEQREEIRLLNEEIKCLQLLLSQAGIPYGKGIQEKERPAALQKDSVMKRKQSGSNLSSRKQSLRSTSSISILFSKDGKMYTVKGQESRILRPGKQDIIRNAGITGSRVFVRNMKKRK